MKNETKVPTIYSIELLRGFAAVGILFWHYQHFFYNSKINSYNFTTFEIQPLYNIISTIYMGGARGVQFFWVISGFIIFHNYSNGTSNSISFLRNRFARLYPLHVLTLLIVTLLQIVSYCLFNSYQIYNQNTFKNFTLNLLFLSGWGFNDGLSFNEPVWSVSVEILIYLIFAILIFTKKQNTFQIILPISIFFFIALKMQIESQVILCGFLFFIGILLKKLSERKFNFNLSLGIILGLIYIFSNHIEFGNYFLGTYIENIVPNGVAISLYSSAILTLVAIEKKYISKFKAGKIMSICSWLGSITYGSYLLHVPLQILILIVINSFRIDQMTFAQSPITLLFYISTVLFLSRYTYTIFEKPWRNRLRAKHF